MCQGDNQKPTICFKKMQIEFLFMFMLVKGHLKMNEDKFFFRSQSEIVYCPRNLWARQNGQPEIYASKTKRVIHIFFFKFTTFHSWK